MTDAFMPPIDDQFTIAPPPVGSIARMPCLVPSSTPLRSTSMIRSYSSIVMSASGCGAADAGDVEHRVDAPERLERGGEHRLDVGLLGHVAVERHDGVAELGRGVLLAGR